MQPKVELRFIVEGLLAVAEACKHATERHLW